MWSAVLKISILFELETLFLIINPMEMTSQMWSILGTMLFGAVYDQIMDSKLHILQCWNDKVNPLMDH